MWAICWSRSRRFRRALLAMTPLGSSMLGVAVCAAVAVGAYWLCAYLFVLSADERTQLGQRIRRSVPARCGSVARQ